MKRILPLLCLLIFFGSCSLNPFSKRKYTNNRVWYKDKYKVEEDSDEKKTATNHQQASPSKEAKKEELLVENNVPTEPEAHQQKKQKPSKNKQDRTKTEHADNKLTAGTTRVAKDKEEKELEFHRGYGMMAMLFGTLTAFLGIGIITFAVGYLSLGVYYQEGNLKKSRAMYYSAFAVGLISFILLLIILI